MGRYWGLSLIYIFVSVQLQAAPGGDKCADLVLQIKAMSKAQQTLLGSMVRKNTSMAETLDQYAEGFAQKGSRLQRTDLVSLKMSAQAFRRHGDREKALVGRFEKSSEELLTKVENCLASSRGHSLETASDLVQR